MGVGVSLSDINPNYCEAVLCVQKARNTLLEAHNRLFECYSEVVENQKNFLSVEVAVEEIRDLLTVMLTDAGLDGVLVDLDRAEGSENLIFDKLFRVGRSLHKVSFEISFEVVSKESGGGFINADLVYYDVVGVVVDEVLP